MLKYILCLLFISLNINAIEMVSPSSVISVDTQNEIISGINSYKSTINSGNHWGDLGSSEYKSNFNIASFGTNQNSSGYIHIKINYKPASQNEMYYFNLKGYAYGASKPINIIYNGYAYGGSLTHLSVHDPSNYFGMHQYVSSDGYLVLRLYSGSIYYLTFVLNSVQVGNGRLFSKEDILNIIINSGANI